MAQYGWKVSAVESSFCLTIKLVTEFRFIYRRSNQVSGLFTIDSLSAMLRVSPRSFIYWTEIVCWILLSTSVVYTCVRTLITRLCATEQAASSRSTINVDPKPDTNKPLFNLAET